MLVINSKRIARSFIVDDPQPEVDIVTIGCEDQLQKRNRLKGLAMQKLVRDIMPSSKDDISIKRIFEEITAKSLEYYIVEKPFRTQNKTFHRKWDYINSNDFEDYVELWSREQTIDKSWKICTHCGQRIKAGEQFSRKCWKCKKGFFRYANEKSSAWKIKTMGAKKRIIDLLLREEYIKHAPLKKRLDFFHYNNGVFEIYESKNKEETGLTTGDLRSTLIYPFIVHNSGFPVKKFFLIYNGVLTEELLREIRKGYGRNFPFKIELCPIGDYLNLNKLHIKTIQVINNDGDYNYNIKKGDSDKIIIDLTQA